MNTAEQREFEELLGRYLDSHPDTPNRTLARLICDVENSKGGDYRVERVRSAIRHRRIANGERNKNNRLGSGRKIFDNPTFRNEYTILADPELHEEPDYVVDEKYNRIGYMSDIHIPKHNNGVLDTAINDFVSRNVNCIIVNGDVLDNPQFSKFAFKPSYTSRTADWLDQAEFFFENLRILFPEALILFIEGNHDAWYRRYLWNQAKAFGDDPHYSLETRLNLTEHNVIWIPETRLVRLADYYVFHGHQHCKGGQLDTTAKRLLNKLKSNCIVGHMHYASMWQDVGISGEPVATVHVSGSMCTLKPSYMPFGGKARLGYMNIDVVDGKCEIENVFIQNGKRLVVFS